jgi:hypothetical protein
VQPALHMVTTESRECDASSGMMWAVWAAGKACNEGHSGWDDVGGGYIGGQEVACCPGVKDDPTSNGSGIS